MKTHRDLPDIPTDPKERQQQIEKLLEHPIWSHSHFIPVPPDGIEIFEPIEGSTFYQFADTTGWPIEDVGDGSWHDLIEISVVYVDPTTERIEDDEFRNTAFRVWLEGGPWFDMSVDPDRSCGGNIPEGGWTKYNKWAKCHDYRLDCGAATMEEALLELARLVGFFYQDNGTDREKVPVRCEGDFERLLSGETNEDKYISGCTDAGDGFCLKCGFNIREG